MGYDGIIKELSVLLDKIYTSFILRDLLAKVIPGIIVIFSFLIIIVKDIQVLINIINSLWLFFFGLSWIVAFGIQSVGEKLKVIKYWPGKKDDRIKWIGIYNQFLSLASNEEKSNLERHIVIKEATGNLAISLILSLIIIDISFIFIDNNNYSAFQIIFSSISIIIFSLFLFLFHRSHIKVQGEYMEEVVFRKKI